MVDVYVLFFKLFGDKPTSPERFDARINAVCIVAFQQGGVFEELHDACMTVPLWCKKKEFVLGGFLV